METRVSRLFILLTVFITITGFFLSPDVNAAFLDDFEDGNHDGWLVTSSTTGGSTGVKSVNESNWAFSHSNHSGTMSLSKEFDYHPNDTLSFDIQALAETGRNLSGGKYYPTYSSSGVTVSFENKFNTNLGGVYFTYHTNSAALSGNGYRITNTPEHFDAMMSEWAELALVEDFASINSIGLEFWAYGVTKNYPYSDLYNATAEVRFDNVRVEAVPLPGAVWLLGSSLLGLVGLKKKFKK